MRDVDLRSFRPRFPRSTALALAALAAAAAAPAQLQFEELTKRHLPARDDWTLAVALGDVDRDGDPDVILGNTRQQNRLYLNDGTGIYTDHTAGRLPVFNDVTYAVALGDVDRDGDLDLVFGNDGQQNRLYLNDGAGTFTDVTAARLPADSDDTYALALQDVDRDGDLDLLVGNEGQNRLYLNDGAGTFTDATDNLPPDGGNTTALVLSDVDRDGDPDLVVANRHPQRQNKLYLNDGTGTFSDAPARMPADNDDTEDVAVRDLDGDGDVDLVFANDGQQNRLYLNDGTGTFADASHRLPADGDDTRAVAISDVDGDGDPDVILGSRATVGQNRLYLNDGTARFTDDTATRMPADRDVTYAVAVGDVDRDGDVDVVFGNAGYQLGQQNRLYLNDGAGTFSDASAPRLPGGNEWAAGLALGDVDGDGDRDLVAANGYSRQQNRLYLNDGRGQFVDATASRMPVDLGFTNAVAMGDVDGDGDRDLVFANGELFLGGEQNRLYLNVGFGAFSDATAARLPADTDFTQAVALADVDGDGDLDVILGNDRQQNRLYLNNGTGTFADGTVARMPADNDNTSSVAAGDVDGDGDVDLVFGNHSQTRQTRLFLNDGAGFFTDATAALMPVDDDFTYAVALGDVDGDGDLDLALGNRPGARARTGQTRLYLNDGRGAFTDATAARVPADSDLTTAVALADLDGDGDADLVVGNELFGRNGRNRLYLNDGAGTFADATSRLPADDDWTAALAVGDVDGDGDTDLVVGNGYQPNRLYANLEAQLAAPFLARVGFSYRLDVYARYGPSRAVDIAVPLLSTGTASIPVPPLGTFGLDPSRTVALPPAVVPQPAGLASVVLAVPNVPALAGAAIFGQALLIQSPTRALLTSVTADVIVP